MTPKPRPTARTRPPWATRALSATSLLAMLSLAACGEERCPQKLNISDWCGKTGRCTVDGATADCGAGACRLPKGVHLEVPIHLLADLLVERREIELNLWNGSPSDVDVKMLVAELDGVRGTHLPPPGPIPRDPFQTAIRWDPFPTSPAGLTLLYDTGATDTAQVNIVLIDYACEAETRELDPL